MEFGLPQNDGARRVWKKNTAGRGKLNSPCCTIRRMLVRLGQKKGPWGGGGRRGGEKERVGGQENLVISAPNGLNTGWEGKQLRKRKLTDSFLFKQKRRLTRGEILSIR